jgi:hypothetical protein
MKSFRNFQHHRKRDIAGEGLRFCLRIKVHMPRVNWDFFNASKSDVWDILEEIKKIIFVENLLRLPPNFTLWG